MKERPILFSAPMVRALLAGTKTQTRRVVKPQPAGAWAAPGKTTCPYGVPGDRLWVRESAWFDRAQVDGVDGIRCFFPGREVRFSTGQAGTAPFVCSAEMLDINTSLRKRPSIHMPRWASRITLEITAVRVERLQDISEADAMAEGAPPSHPSIDRISREFGYPDFSRSWYGQLWDQINGPGAWEENPWVWVVEFKRVNP